MIFRISNNPKIGFLPKSDFSLTSMPPGGLWPKLCCKPCTSGVACSTSNDWAEVPERSGRTRNPGLSLRARRHTMHRVQSQNKCYMDHNLELFISDPGNIWKLIFHMIYYPGNIWKCFLIFYHILEIFKTKKQYFFGVLELFKAFCTCGRAGREARACYGGSWGRSIPDLFAGLLFGKHKSPVPPIRPTLGSGLSGRNWAGLSSSHQGWVDSNRNRGNRNIVAGIDCNIQKNTAQYVIGIEWNRIQKSVDFSERRSPDSLLLDPGNTGKHFSWNSSWILEILEREVPNMLCLPGNVGNLFASICRPSLLFPKQIHL